MERETDGTRGERSERRTGGGNGTAHDRPFTPFVTHVGRSPCRSTHHLVRHGARRGRVNDGGVNEEPGGRSEDEVGMNDERT